jgi:GT2 family glycosyltransferase
LNEGFAAARGSILGNVSADDMYVAPSTVSAVVNYWQSHPDLGCVYGRLLYVDKNGLPFLPVQTHATGPWSTWLLRYVFFTSLLSLFVSREIVIRENLWFDPTFQLAGDWDWVIRLSKTGCKFGYLNRTLSMHRIHADQASRVKADTMRVERREICRRYCINYPLLLMVYGMLSSSKRCGYFEQKG